jgi:hypothetical protein
MIHNELPQTIVEVPANWWRMVALRPELNLLIMADSEAWTLDEDESLKFTLLGMASLGMNPSTATTEQIAGFTVNRILAFTPLLNPLDDDDFIIVANN